MSDETQKTGPRRIERVLGAVAACLAVVLAAGTVYALAAGLPAKKAIRSALAASEPDASGQDQWLDLGRLRAEAADGSVVVARIVLPYSGADRAFREELAGKRTELKALARELLESVVSGTIQEGGEGAVKAGLRDRLNAILVLGALDTVYFTEFQVIP